MQLVTATADFTQSVPAALAQTAWLWKMNEGEKVTARQHAGTAVISEGHKDSRCSVKMLSRQRYSYSYSADSSQNYSYSAEYSKPTIRYTPSFNN